MARLRRVVPNERWQLILDFGADGIRRFDGEVARREKGFHQFAYPQKFKNLTYTEELVRWGGGEELDSTWLYSRSRPELISNLEHEVLRVAYRNQAPTPAHQSHHVYCVYLAPFSAKPFRVGQSIGGGHADTGGGEDLSIAGLLGWREWKLHFELSGCKWAIPLIESGADDEQKLINAVVKEICLRAGKADSAADSGL